MLHTGTVRILFSIVLVSLLSGGCSTMPKTGLDTQPPLRQYDQFFKPEREYLIQVYDPIEGWNRGVYRFNYYFDKVIYIPIVKAYEFILPDYVEDRISNFVDNVLEFNNFTNNLLQMKLKPTGITLSRFAINSTVGVAGLWDPATEWGLRRQTEDFGQTLGHYGLGHGPYLMLPILGPSNLRDTFGLVTDAVSFTSLGPPAWVDNDDVTMIFNGVTAVDKRHRIPFRYYESGSPFEYENVRMLYTRKREVDIQK